jgi:hypothetical protein
MSDGAEPILCCYCAEPIADGDAVYHGFVSGVPGDHRHVTCPAPSDISVEPTVFDVHPLPWRVGEQNESMAEVRDARGVVVLHVAGGAITGHAKPGRVAAAVVLAMLRNGTVESESAK